MKAKTPENTFDETAQEYGAEKTTLGGYTAYVQSGFDEYYYTDVGIVSKYGAMLALIMHEGTDKDREAADRMYAMLDTIVID